MRQHPSWVVFVLAAAIATMAALSVVSASAAQPAADTGVRAVMPADAAPAINGEYCGTQNFNVPDSGPYFSFSDACKEHDECYADGGDEGDREDCDNEFLADMIESCQKKWPPTSLTNLYNRNRCYRVAWAYYIGVRVGGSEYFNYMTCDVSGEWTDASLPSTAQVLITVTGSDLTGDFLLSGRPDFSGTLSDGGCTIQVNFPDDDIYTATFSAETLTWSNSSVWTRPAP